jgi:hypothetical protein
MKTISFFISVFLLPVFISAASQAGELGDLLVHVEALNISRYDYTLGKVLTEKQKKTALVNPVKNKSPITFKFKDRNLNIVAHRTTDRVLILYEQYDQASREKVRDLVGSLFLDFGDPTVFTHDKIIYWAFNDKGKPSGKEYHETKDKGGKLEILATVKLNSSMKIMENADDSDSGSVYYSISSEPVLKLIQSYGE